MRLKKFQIQNFRNVIDSGWIDVNSVTAFVGQNEAGKSNLFEALYKLNPYQDDEYDDSIDWPVDDWKGRTQSDGKPVASAIFELEPGDLDDLVDEATAESSNQPEEEESSDKNVVLSPPKDLRVWGYRGYGRDATFKLIDAKGKPLDLAKFNLDQESVSEWLSLNVPKFVLIQDYDFSGNQVELNELKQRLDKVGGHENAYQLSAEDQTILIVLELAQIELEDFLAKANTAEGRTLRQFDKRAASAFLTKQFQALWAQKKVKFEIDIDGPTLNIFAEDEAIGFPVRLNRRSTGFRWYVSFAWKFTHASEGEFENCTLLLEEPGIHLHHSGQRDLLKVFEDLSETNTVLYTTHLSSMVDLANPERVRIVETDADHHLKITEGVVSSQSGAMAVIESSLGLTSDLSGMLGNRRVLIVEGGTDALILNKLSGLMVASGKVGLSDQIYLWPAQSSSKTPMYAAFAIGQRWNAGVLLDTDEAGNRAAKQIKAMELKEYAEELGHEFRILMLSKASGVKKTDVAIEDLFPDDWFLGCVNRAYGVAIKIEDLPEDGSTLIAKRVETALKARHNRDLDKKLVLREMLNDFDQWTKVSDLPDGVADRAEALFSKINAAFEAE